MTRTEADSRLKALRDKAALPVLAALLALPALMSWLYSLERDPVWLVRALLGLGLALAVTLVVLGGVRRQGARLALGLLLIESLALYQLIRLTSYYFQGEGFNQRFFFHFNLNSVSEGGTAYLPLIFGGLAIFFLIGLLALPVARRAAERGGAARVLAVLLLPAAFLLTDPDGRGLGSLRGPMQPTGSMSLESLDWDGVGLDRAALERNLEDAAPGKNLVFIYLESLESLYTDENAFPGLTPRLSGLMEEGLRFTNIRQDSVTAWTVGGIVASQCATPLITSFPQGGNDILQNGFLDRAVCLGDVLDAAGYRQIYMGGASLGFAGKGAFLAAHGYDEVLGRDALLPQLDDPEYKNGWGLYDDSLFSLALKRFDELSRQPPFNLTLLTLDTHHPDGHASASCPPYPGRDNSMLHAVHCDDHLLGEFLDALRRHPAWEDTVVVLYSDHLAMRNVAQRHYPRNYDRTLLFSILNSGQAGEIERPGSPLDVAPTVLDVMGVRHSQNFLAGDSLVSGEGLAERPPFFSEQRLQALRYLNARHLTGAPPGLCASEYMVRVEGQRLLAGEREIKLSQYGNPLPLDALKYDHAMLARVDAEGQLLGTMTVHRRNLAHVLYRYRDELLLLLASRHQLPGFMDEVVEGGPVAGVGVYLGSLRSGFSTLHAAPEPVSLALPSTDCQSAFETASQEHREALEEERPMPGLAALCPAGKEASAGEAVPRRLAGGEILLPRVAVGQNWEQARLKGNRAEGFEIVERNPLGAIGRIEPGDYCHPHYSEPLLLIPALSDEGELFSVVMEREAGSERLQILEWEPWPEV